MAAGTHDARRRLSAGFCRVLVVACCLPVFWAPFDQVVLAQAAGGEAPASAPQDDDDDMAQLTAPARPARPVSAVWRVAAPEGDRRQGSSVRPGADAPPAPRCEHDLRNGFGAPLLC